jgi:hypothetical protein
VRPELNFENVTECVALSVTVASTVPTSSASASADELAPSTLPPLHALSNAALSNAALLTSVRRPSPRNLSALRLDTFDIICDLLRARRIAASVPVLGERGWARKTQKSWEKRG